MAKRAKSAEPVRRKRKLPEDAVPIRCTVSMAMRATARSAAGELDMHLSDFARMAVMLAARAVKGGKLKIEDADVVAFKKTGSLAS